MTTNRFLAALLSFALILVGAIVAIPAGEFDWKAGIQLAILGVSTGATLGLPLIPSIRWQGILKTGVPVLLALLSAVTPLIVGGKYDHVTVGLFVLGIMQALASEVGIMIRKTAAAADMQLTAAVDESKDLTPAQRDAALATTDQPALAALSADLARS